MSQAQLQEFKTLYNAAFVGDEIAATFEALVTMDIIPGDTLDSSDPIAIALEKCESLAEVEALVESL